MVVCTIEQYCGLFLWCDDDYTVSYSALYLYMHMLIHLHQHLITKNNNFQIPEHMMTAML